MNKIMRSFLMAGLIILSTPAMASSVWQPMTDTVNSGIINTKMMSDKALSKTQVDATVINGVAVFSGEVDTKAQAEALVRIARSVSGVKGVDVSKLKIKQQ